MNAELLNNFIQLESLLRKYQHYGQAHVVSEIIASIHRGEPAYKRLAGVDMWGGSGSVSDVNLIPSGTKSEEDKREIRAFRQAIVNLAAEIDKLGIGHARSRDIAVTFREWIKMFDSF
jgi:hypothetical protein